MADPASIPAPNYTQIPNAIFELMADKDAHLTEAELRVILAIARKTFGWHKKRDKISLSQLETLTAMSRPSIVAGLEAAIDRGIVRRTPDKNDKRGGFFYELAVDEPNDQTSKKSELVKEVNQSNIFTRTSKESLPELVKNFNPQKKEKEKKERGRESQADPPTPAIEIYIRLTERKPTKIEAEMIAEQVTDLARWEREIKNWITSGYKAANVKGMLDWYHGRGRHQNGQRPAESRPELQVKPFKPDDDALSPEARKQLLRELRP